VFVFGIWASLIDLKVDLEGPSSLRDLLLDRSNLPIPNTNPKFPTRTQKLRTSQSVCHIPLGANFLLLIVRAKLRTRTSGDRSNVD
jgi:hypothetical protein